MYEVGMLLLLLVCSIGMMGVKGSLGQPLFTLIEHRHTVRFGQPKAEFYLTYRGMYLKHVLYLKGIMYLLNG